MKKAIAVIDLKSFYSSVECACRHLDMFETPLVCCDPYRSDSSVVMSVTPYLKKVYGVPNVCRKRDLPKIKGMIYARPRMSYYLKMAAEVIRIFRNYVAEEDIHVYSVDESFLNIGPYLSLYQCTADELVERIKKDIHEELGLVATAGIGDSMFMAKCALDQEGKKCPPYIATWKQKDYEEKLWSIPKLHQIWGIANGIESHLKRIGIRTPKELGEASVTLLESEFGVIGRQLHDLMHGIDESDLRSPYQVKEKSLHLGQTLIRDYSYEECFLLIKEMSDDLRRRLRKEKMLARKVFLGVAFAKGKGSYAKECRLLSPTKDKIKIETAFLSLLEEVPHEYQVRQIFLSLGGLSRESYLQGNFFDDLEREKEQEHLDEKMDEIIGRYGEDALMRCSSLKDYSTAKLRHAQIGGHRR